MNWEQFLLFMMMPVAGLLFGAIAFYTARRDSHRYDKRHDRHAH